MGTATAPNRILLLGGTSEIGLAILSALDLGPDTQVLLAGRDLHRLAEAGAALPGKVRTIRYDAADLAQPPGDRGRLRRRPAGPGDLRGRRAGRQQASWSGTSAKAGDGRKPTSPGT